MFHSYRSVVWLILLITAGVYVPFYVSGFSTDVWIRLVRIQEWSTAGFPFKEILMAGQNYPFGHEMHWTRPLDWIGYMGAWPFIPNWGLSKALEIMACFMPLVVMLLAVMGYIYAVRGYLTPKLALASFIIFGLVAGYGWGQGSIGYYDHHIFHFALLVWAVALTARFFLFPQKVALMISAGMITALGTWITAEFFIISYLILIPFVWGWLFFDRSLKPAILFSLSYVCTLSVALSFDHPIAGFWVLDFYRFSLFHIILGSLNAAALILLSLFFTKIKTTCLRRFIYGGVVASFYICALIPFLPILLTPMAEPFLFYFWVSRVSEMAPLYESWIPLLVYAFFPIVLGIGMFSFCCLRPREKQTPIILLCSVGLLFYSLIVIHHVRVGISVHAFFLLLASYYLGLVFFPREYSFKRTLFFVLYTFLFLGTCFKGEALLSRLSSVGVNYYREEYKNNPNVDVPAFLKEAFDQEIKAEKENNLTEEEKLIQEMEENYPEDETFSCSPTEDVIQFLKETKNQGGLFVDLFSSPEILWKTKRPLFSGPYHTNVAGITDLFAVQFDRPPFETAHRILTERNIKQLYVANPRCFRYLFENRITQEMQTDLFFTFHFAVYYETEDLPNWLELAYHDKKANIKIFNVIYPEQKKDKD